MKMLSYDSGNSCVYGPGLAAILCKLSRQATLEFHGGRDRPLQPSTDTITNNPSHITPDTLPRHLVSHQTPGVVSDT